MVFLGQGFVGGADHLWRRISRDLEVVVVGVDRPQSESPRKHFIDER